MNKLPDFQAHLGRHGHNLTHDFSFTSGTGHLLTLMSYLMYPKDTIKGQCQMFTRTQPLLNPANCEIDEFIDYFFVPLDMLMSGFGDFLYQINEPYSAITKANLSKLVNNDLTLPVIKFQDLVDELDLYEGLAGTPALYKIKTDPDFYEKDWRFFSVYRNLFHNYMNPNALFRKPKLDAQGNHDDVVWPIDLFQPNTLPLTAMAYNCVYEQVYRIDDREEFDPNIYNIDKFVYDGSDLFSGLANKFFSLKYRPKHFDYFTSVNPTPFANSQNLLTSDVVGSNLMKINNYMSSSGIIPQASNPAPAQSSGSFDDATSFSALKVPNNVQVFNTSNIRSIFAVEKVLSITQRAKKTYDAQVMAHLGVDVPHDVLHQIIKLGTQHTEIKVGEVVSTAGTSDTPLGDIAGKGYAVLPDKGINFTAPCHGIFIAIYSAVPRFRYYAPLPKHAQISSVLDFFVPEYEKLGTQPVYGFEATPMYLESDGQPDNGILGWQMRYEQYKRMFNRVSPAFVDTVVQSHTPGHVYEGTTIQTFNGWHNWTIVRRPASLFAVPSTPNLVNRFTLDDFLCGAAELNGLMAVDYFDFKDWKKYNVNHPNFVNLNDAYTIGINERDSVIWNLAQLFYRDPLLHFCKPNFKIVNKMNDNTLPDFID